MDSRHYHYQKLTEARELQGKTQQDVADELNVDRQTVYRAEAGKAASYELLVKLAALYRLPMTVLIIDFPEVAASTIQA